VPKISSALRPEKLKLQKALISQWDFNASAVGISQAEDVLSEKHLTKLN